MVTDKDFAHVTIGQEQLLELLQITVDQRCPYDISQLPYDQAQVTLLLSAIETWLGTFGVGAPYKLDLPKDPDFDSDPDEWGKS